MEPNLLEIFGSYMAWKAAEDTWFISFMNGSQCLYLLEGEKKALLIDTGYAAGNLKEFVEKLTDKPIIVVNTHYHPDHSGGNGEFEEVLLGAGYPIDAPSVETPGTGPFPLDRLPHPDYKKTVIKEGDKIELGGRTIEVMDVKPAHCNSSLFFLDRKMGLIFTGDEFESAQTIMYDNSMNPDAPYDVRERIQNMKENAIRLLDMRDAYKWILPNHNGFPMAESYLEDYVGLADAIFAGTAIIEDKLNHKYIEMDPKAPELCRVRYGSVSIFIKKEEVLKIYGK